MHRFRRRYRVTKTALEEGPATGLLNISLIWWGSLGEGGGVNVPPPWLSEVIRRYPLPSVPTDVMYPLGGQPPQPQPGQQPMTIAPQHLAQRPQQSIPAHQAQAALLAAQQQQQQQLYQAQLQQQRRQASGQPSASHASPYQQHRSLSGGAGPGRPPGQTSAIPQGLPQQRVGLGAGRPMPAQQAQAPSHQQQAVAGPPQPSVAPPAGPDVLDSRDLETTRHRAIARYMSQHLMMASICDGTATRDLAGRAVATYGEPLTVEDVEAEKARLRAELDALKAETEEMKRAHKLRMARRGGAIAAVSS